MNIIFNDYDGRDSYYEKIRDDYVVWLGTKGDKQTNKMHELAHINLGTDVEEAREKIAIMVMKSSILPEMIERKRFDIVEMFFQVWNILEDERVESFSPRLFKKHKTAMGKTKTEKDVKSTPIEALLCARFNRDELIDWHVKNFIKSSRLASKEKIYKLTEMFCKYYIVPFINEDKKIYYGRDGIRKSYKQQHPNKII